MSHWADLPPFEVVNVEDASHTAAKRLRIDVALSPEDFGQVGQVALEVITRHAGDNDVVWLFFHPSATIVDWEPAAIHVQYARNDMRPDFRPEPITSPLGTIEIETVDGVITVENVRNA